MDPERQEVYERIPWETLEKKGGDRQWLVMAVAGAIAVAALAYSFMKNQPVPASSPTVAAPVAVSPTVSSIPVTPTTTQPSSPVVMAEADLYAVDPDQMAQEIAAHAEWFAVEYFNVDGSEESRQTLSSLLPSGVPLPETPDGVQVFVDWVGAGAVTEIAPLTYEVDVLVRSLMAQGDTAFARQPPRVATVTLTVDDGGVPHVASAPSIEVQTPPAPVASSLVQVPADIQALVESSHGPVVGGIQDGDGTWRVVAMVTGIDGVRRPQTVVAP